MGLILSSKLRALSLFCGFFFTRKPRSEGMKMFSLGYDRPMLAADEAFCHRIKVDTGTGLTL